MSLVMKNPISRFPKFCLAMGMVLAAAIHVAGERLLAGLVMGLTAGGHYRAYAEAAATGAHTTAVSKVTVDATHPLFKWFRAGDTVTNLSDTTVGTIQSIDRDTGEIFFTGNLAVALADGEGIKIKESECSIENKNGRILSVTVDVDSEPVHTVAGYHTGYFKIDALITPHAISKLGYESETNELRIL